VGGCGLLALEKEKVCLFPGRRCRVLVASTVLGIDDPETAAPSCGKRFLELFSGIGLKACG
jgi:hypothetical protein